MTQVTVTDIPQDLVEHPPQFGYRLSINRYQAQYLFKRVEEFKVLNSTTGIKNPSPSSTSDNDSTEWQANIGELLIWMCRDSDRHQIYEFEVVVDQSLLTYVMDILLFRD